MLSGTKSKSRLVGFIGLTIQELLFIDNHQAGVDAYSMWAINIDGTKPKELVEGKWETVIQCR